MTNPSLDPTRPASSLDRGRIWGPVGMMLVLSSLSLGSGIQVQTWSFPASDKVAHLAVYGLLGIAWVRSFRRERVGFSQGLFFATLLAAGFGVFDECLQSTNPHRYFEWADMVADLVGAVVAVSTYLLVPWFQAFLELEIRVIGRLRNPVHPPNFPP